MALVNASIPSGRAPELPLDPDMEAALEASDRERAAIYASMDDLSDKFEQLADDIDSGPQNDAIPVEISEDEDSLAVHVDAALDSTPVPRRR